MNEMLVFASVFSGMMLGVITGLIPGLHVNNLAAIMVSLSLASDYLAFLVVSMSVTHTFVDFIPSIMLGAPSQESFLSVLPGHEYLLKGKALKAVKLSAIGGLVAGTLSLIILPLYFFFLKDYIVLISRLIPFVLAGVLLLMILSEDRKLWAVLVVCLSGLLGVLSFKVTPKAITGLVTGLFGASTLLYSLKSKPPIIAQEAKKEEYNARELAKGGALAMIGGSIVSVMPAIGPAQAAFIIRKFLSRLNPREYLVLLGGINTSNMMYSFIVLYVIGKARTGSAIALRDLMPAYVFDKLLLVLGVALVSLASSYIITIVLAGKLARVIGRINYSSVSVMALAGLIVIVAGFSGFKGLLVFSVATAVGLLPLAVKVKRTTTMAFLMIPTLLYYIL